MTSNEPGAGKETPQPQPSSTDPASQQKAIEEQKELIASLKEELTAYKKVTASQQEQIDAQGKMIIALDARLAHLEKTAATSKQEQSTVTAEGTKSTKAEKHDSQQLKMSQAEATTGGSSSGTGSGVPLTAKGVQESLYAQIRALQENREKWKDEAKAFEELGEALAEYNGVPVQDLDNPVAMAARHRALAERIRRRKADEDAATAAAAPTATAEATDTPHQTTVSQQESGRKNH